MSEDRPSSGMSTERARPMDAAPSGPAPKQRARSFLVGIALLFSAVAAATAQSSLQGRVVDPNRAPIAGARVTAEPEHGAAVSAITDQLGAFTMALPTGPYSLKIAA